MTESKRPWMGLANLLFDAVDGTTDLVEATQDDVADTVVDLLSAVPELGAPARRVEFARRAIAHLTTGSIRTVNDAVRQLSGAGERAAPPPAPEAPVPMRSDVTKGRPFVVDALRGALNGIVGDHLRAQGNPLDLGMQLRFEDRFFAPEEAQDVLPSAGPTKLALFVHGLMATENLWALDAEAAWGAPDVTYGTKLRDDLGHTPIYLRYNSGLHISDNGRSLSALLTRLLAHLPATTELTLVGHSLGGLVARSATHYGAADAAPWLSRLRHVVTLGTPHLGAPLAEGGQLLTAGLGAVDLPATQVIAKIARRRSAAIKDLRGGYLVQEDWHGKDPDAWLAGSRTEVAFVDGVGYLFVGSSVTKDPDDGLGRVIGDLLVRLPSATYAQSTFPLERRTLGGLDHVALQNHPDVYAQVRDFLASGGPDGAG